MLAPWRIQLCKTPQAASLHPFIAPATPSNRVQRISHSRACSNTATQAASQPCGSLLLLAASQPGLQPQRHGRPRTQLQVAVLPDAPHSVEIPIGDGAPLILETGRIGRQADAAVVAKRGGTTVYATLCVGDADAGGGDFLPMSIDYQERYSATGRTSGAYNKRDGRASDGEILTCRLIDRPLEAFRC